MPVILSEDGFTNSIYEFGEKMLPEEVGFNTASDGPPEPMLVGNFGDEDM